MQRIWTGHHSAAKFAALSALALLVVLGGCKKAGQVPAAPPIASPPAVTATSRESRAGVVDGTYDVVWTAADTGSTTLRMQFRCDTATKCVLSGEGLAFELTRDGARFTSSSSKDEAPSPGCPNQTINETLDLSIDDAGRLVGIRNVSVSPSQVQCGGGHSASHASGETRLEGSRIN